MGRSLEAVMKYGERKTRTKTRKAKGGKRRPAKRKGVEA
jgi:hypothetical protein